MASRIKSKNVPIGLKIISFLYFLDAFFLFMGSIGLIFFRDYFTSLSSDFLLASRDNFFISAIVIFIISLLVFGIGFFLLKLNRFARLLVIIFSIFGVISSTWTLFNGEFSSLISLIIDGLIAGYLLFDKKIKSLFN